ncbi:MAG: hypothetical protein AMJ54_08475 [Deltaproteobacteria bacterium SG8_13]|nr:MAG: hypothetical protein AMJ54_08475 [Deltaproteobacteria bacterium SG8_13]
MGFILLEGGAEFGGQMAAADLRAMELAGGPQARLRVIPAAAAPDDNHRRAGRNAERWFRKLGATDAAALPLVDRQSAQDAILASTLRESRMIYMLGGFPQYLAQSLAGTAAWEAICQAWKAGAVVGGSSAGAMVLCDYYYNPADDRVLPGLGLVAGACVLPHHDTFGQHWAPRIKRLLPDAVMIGIDEQTGMLDDAASGRWQVYGRGTVTVYREQRIQRFRPADAFPL